MAYRFILFWMLLAPQWVMAQGDKVTIETKVADTSSTNTTPPNYNDLYYWSAHPLKKDMADSVFSFIKNEKQDSSVDVFYIHPTTFTKDYNGEWNANLANEALNKQTDVRPVLFQASAFNGSCKVYAPRYRQAHLKAFFMAQSPKAKEAFEMAYDDIKSAFDFYLQHYNNNRPIVIAAHSQGAKHAIRLLQDYFENKPLAQQLVCAYVVGWKISKDDFKAISFCSLPQQTGCVVGWRSYRDGQTDLMVLNEDDNSYCIKIIVSKVY